MVIFVMFLLRMEWFACSVLTIRATSILVVLRLLIVISLGFLVKSSYDILFWLFRFVSRFRLMPVAGR